ncbi:MAG: hypothetical protein GF383_04420 [Candidatus Lokiarchaeota archaeon]|nr:hypothetical protein [Candidatus Lokiarchaeota archaeon]MBD3339034.1 hypothetical protein [Candidatus Lokiarchaeota archaeon]
MSPKGICSICNEETKVFQCVNDECKKWVCIDCSNEYIMPMLEYFFRDESLPILKCPHCGNDLKYEE